MFNNRLVDVFQDVTGVTAKDDVNAAGAVVFLRIRLIRPLREGPGPPTPGKDRMPGKVPEEFFQDLDRMTVPVPPRKVGIIVFLPDPVNLLCPAALEEKGPKPLREITRPAGREIFNDPPGGRLGRGVGRRGQTGQKKEGDQTGGGIHRGSNLSVTGSFPL